MCAPVTQTRNMIGSLRDSPGAPREGMTSPTDSKSAADARRRSPSFDLVFQPSVELISLVRRFVADFYVEAVADPDTASRLALTTHELLENAARYSTDGEAALHVELDSVAGTVAVRTRNRATAAQIDTLKRSFAEISAAPDATALYAEMLRRSAVQRSGSGGLGLARVWAESDMTLRLVIANDQVEIRAQGTIKTAE